MTQNGPAQTSIEISELPAKRYLTQELAQIEVYGRIEKVICKMANLSTSGAFFEIISSNYIPRMGDVIRLTINLRSIKRVHIMNAEIIWSKGLGLGIQFLTTLELQQRLSAKVMSSL